MFTSGFLLLFDNFPAEPRTSREGKPLRKATSSSHEQSDIERVLALEDTMQLLIQKIDSIREISNNNNNIVFVD